MLKYDEDNRTTSINWDAGITSKLITNRYDALGRRIAKKVDGIETRYVLDLSGGMERILCDTTASGQITAYYIHGPDLCYRVDATNNIICYHADAQANIIAVTGGGGTNVAQYAYTPYGRSLGSTNLQSQISNPYLFVGSQGVMEELPSLYFMRARYYSADAGVFLSTDPVKKIGPGWKSIAYEYAGGNPVASIDPKGEDFGASLLIVAGILLAADALLEWADLPIADADNTLKVRTGQMSKGQFQIQRASDIVDVIPGNKLWDEVKFGAGVAKAMNSGDWLSIVPVVGPIRSMNNLIESMGNTVRTLNGNTQNGVNTKMTVPSFSAPSTLNPVQVTPQSSPTTSNPNVIRAGQTLNVSSGGGTTSSSGGTGSTTYTVRAGDTLGNIGYANGTTAAAIGSANGIQNLNLIRPGQVLKIPGKK